MTGAGKGRMAAVLYGDLVGFSALQGWDEAAAAKRLAAWRELLAAEVTTGGGRLTEAAGEGAVAEFPGAGQAFACAERALRRIATRNAGLPAGERFEVTFGLAIGDVTDEGGELFGPAVQTAVAAHTLADPGGIAMTDAAYVHVARQAAVHGTLLRPRRFTNLPDPVRVFVVPPPRVNHAMWVLRKRGLVPAAALGLGVLVALGGALAWYLLPVQTATTPPADAPATGAPRAEQVLMTFPTTDYISSYDGGGSTLKFSVDPGPDARPRLRLVMGGANGWWGVVIARSFDLSAFDTLVVTVRSERGVAFRIMVKDDNDAWTATVSAGTTESPVAIPLASLVTTVDAKAPGDGRFNAAGVKEIQLMQAGSAVADTVWIASLAATGPAPVR